MKRFGSSVGALAGCALFVLAPISEASFLDDDALPGVDDLCQQTAVRVARSCRVGAESDFWLASAKCSNLATDAMRTKCEAQALDDKKDALVTCEGQRGARQAACTRLGGGAYAPVIDPADFVATIDNPYFPLKPGTTFIYEGQSAEGLVHGEFSVTHNTKVILGVTCVEVRDTVTVNGELTEDTLDWFAQDKLGNVWYMGENSKQLAGGLIVGVEGSWTGGVDGAKPGIIMHVNPTIGRLYRQEFALDTAEDLAEVLSLTEAVTVAAASCDRCLETQENSPLEPGAVEHKFYAPGIGNVLTIDLITGERLELVQIKTE